MLLADNKADESTETNFNSITEVSSYLVDWEKDNKKRSGNICGIRIKSKKLITILYKRCLYIILCGLKKFNLINNYVIKP